MTTLAGILVLPFLLWSWLRGHNEEDADLAVGLIGWLTISVSGLLLAWWLVL